MSRMSIMTSWMVLSCLALASPAIAWEIAVADSGGLVPYHSLKVVNGNPAISFSGVDNLMYVRAADADGASWSAPMLVETFGPDDNVWGMSLQVVGGLPATSYFYWQVRELRFAYDGPWPVELVGFTGE